MDEALVKNAEHEIDDQDRDDEEEPLALERRLKRLGRALEAPDDRGREPELALDLLDLRHRLAERQDRKSTRLNSSHSQISYAVFCLKKNTACRAPRYL